ncbi:hypothetical protein DFQ28_002827 [Apophysomyces sp. BC1034]|nr:hypothetical protein DFQ30_003107 [Apophysomyces sp. BC1015]KAG0179493.1 hypothetical protein DFQ29_002037 [Apophysomyces sp. BC1021]KAG0189852.1 hypothetical protein DFQ28_002827 [Apophysomyces sp. BC1034]
MDKFDITIFGATGLTGKKIVDHVYELSATQSKQFPPGFRWAVAGRDEDRLHEIVEAVEKQYPSASISRPGVIVANVVRRETVDEMTRQSKVLINAVGPFRFMGEYVVRSCVEQGCDYVDVTGEPEFVERMQRTYHTQAERKQVTIVHSCGFDSVPTDMGVLWIKQLYTSRGWTPAWIEMFLRVHAPDGLRAGYATYESAVHGFGSVELLREIRKVSGLTPLPRPTGPRLRFHKLLTWDKKLGYHVPFLFADPSIVRLSQQLFLTGYAKPRAATTGATMPPTVQFAAYLLLPSLRVAFAYYFYGFIFSILASSPWGRRVLLNNPERFSHGVFSKKHPTDDMLRKSSFEIVLRSKGYDKSVGFDGDPNQNITVVVRGPEAGYVATPRIVLQCALTLLLTDKPKLPVGVLTPSVAFWNTDLIDRLQQVGITYTQS